MSRNSLTYNVLAGNKDCTITFNLNEGSLTANADREVDNSSTVSARNTQLSSSIISCVRTIMEQTGASRVTLDFAPKSSERWISLSNGTDLVVITEEVSMRGEMYSMKTYSPNKSTVKVSSLMPSQLADNIKLSVDIESELSKKVQSALMSYKENNKREGNRKIYNLCEDYNLHAVVKSVVFMLPTFVANKNIILENITDLTVLIAMTHLANPSTCSEYTLQFQLTQTGYEGIISVLDQLVTPIIVEKIPTTSIF